MPNENISEKDITGTVARLNEQMGNSMWDDTDDFAPNTPHSNESAVLDTVNEWLSDVEVSHETEAAMAQHLLDDQMLHVLNDPDTSEAEREEAREYLDRRRVDILAANDPDRRGGIEKPKPDPGQGGAAMEAPAPRRDDGAAGVARGIGKTLLSLGRAARRSRANRPRPTGDIMVSSYAYTKDGKNIRVKAHKRRRSNQPRRRK